MALNNEKVNYILYHTISYIKNLMFEVTVIWPSAFVIIRGYMVWLYSNTKLLISNYTGHEQQCTII
jgi:hypothetical protein